MRFSEIGPLMELSRPRSRDKAEWILINAGYKQLGRGANGAVFQKHGAPYVLKLFDARDEAYINFIRLVGRTPNPHFPKFIGKVIRIAEGYFAVRTEFLTKCTGRLEEIQTIDSYILLGVGMDPIVGADVAREYMDAHPDMKAACDALIRFLGQNTDFICDVHQYNVMERDGVLVLSDPVAMS